MSSNKGRIEMNQLVPHVLHLYDIFGLERTRSALKIGSLMLNDAGTTSTYFYTRRNVIKNFFCQAHDLCLFQKGDIVERIGEHTVVLSCPKCDQSDPCRFVCLVCCLSYPSSEGL